MFSGKTEELIRLVRRTIHARRRVQVFKSSLDIRCHTTVITLMMESASKLSQYPILVP